MKNLFLFSKNHFSKYIFYLERFTEISEKNEKDEKDEKELKLFKEEIDVMGVDEIIDFLKEINTNENSLAYEKVATAIKEINNFYKNIGQPIPPELNTEINSLKKTYQEELLNEFKKLSYILHGVAYNELIIETNNPLPSKNAFSPKTIESIKNKSFGKSPELYGVKRVGSIDLPAKLNFSELQIKTINNLSNNFEKKYGKKNGIEKINNLFGKLYPNEILVFLDKALMYLENNPDGVPRIWIPSTGLHKNQLNINESVKHYTQSWNSEKEKYVPKRNTHVIGRRTVTEQFKQEPVRIIDKNYGKIIPISKNFFEENYGMVDYDYEANPKTVESFLKYIVENNAKSIEICTGSNCLEYSKPQEEKLFAKINSGELGNASEFGPNENGFYNFYLAAAKWRAQNLRDAILYQLKTNPNYSRYKNLTVSINYHGENGDGTNGSPSPYDSYNKNRNNRLGAPSKGNNKLPPFQGTDKEIDDIAVDKMYSQWNNASACGVAGSSNPEDAAIPVEPPPTIPKEKIKIPVILTWGDTKPPVKHKSNSGNQGRVQRTELSFTGKIDTTSCRGAQ